MVKAEFDFEFEIGLTLCPELADRRRGPSCRIPSMIHHDPFKALCLLISKSQARTSISTQDDSTHFNSPKNNAVTLKDRLVKIRPDPSQRRSSRRWATISECWLHNRCLYTWSSSPLYQWYENRKSSPRAGKYSLRPL